MYQVYQCTQTKGGNQTNHYNYYNKINWGNEHEPFKMKNMFWNLWPRITTQLQKRPVFTPSYKCMYVVPILECFAINLANFWKQKACCFDRPTQHSEKCKPKDNGLKKQAA